MSTFGAYFFIMLNYVFIIKTPIHLLVKSFMITHDKACFIGLARPIEVNNDSNREEFYNPSKTGVIIKSTLEPKAGYFAQKVYSFFGLLLQIVRNPIGLKDIISDNISRMGDVSRIFFNGEYTLGIDSGNNAIFSGGQPICHTYFLQLRSQIVQEIQKQIFINNTPTSMVRNCCSLK